MKIEFENGSTLETIQSKSKPIRGNRAKIRLFYNIELTCWQRIMLWFYCTKIDIKENIKNMMWRKL